MMSDRGSVVEGGGVGETHLSSPLSLSPNLQGHVLALFQHS